MNIYKADLAIIDENDFEEVEKGRIYIDRKDGFVAIADPNKPEILLVELETDCDIG